MCHHARRRWNCTHSPIAARTALSLYTILCPDCRNYLNTPPLLKLPTGNIICDKESFGTGFDIDMITAKVRELSLLYNLQDIRVLLFAFCAYIIRNFGSMCRLKQHSTCSSPQYCAPEVRRFKIYDGRVAEMLSLGVILFAITTCELPSTEDNFYRLYTWFRTRIFEIPDLVPSCIAQVIPFLLTSNPSNCAIIRHITNKPWFRKMHPRPDIFTRVHLLTGLLISNA